VSYPAGGFLVRQKLSAVKKVIYLSFTFEKHNDWSLLSVDLFDIFHYGRVKFQTMDFFKFYNSFTVEAIN
jgi:hypothetical protein